VNIACAVRTICILANLFAINCCQVFDDNITRLCELPEIPVEISSLRICDSRGAEIASLRLMARPLRVHIPGALYHVMSRGNARQEIFFGSEDYEYFLERLSVTATRLQVRCRAHCLTFLALDDVWKAFEPADQRRAQERNADFVGAGAADFGDAPTGPVVYGSGTFVTQVGLTLASHRDKHDIVHAERFAVRPPLDQLFTHAGDAHSRDASMREAYERHGYTLREIGAFVGRHPGTVWRRIRCVGERVGNEAEKIEI
jgi:hypothetical protein